MKVLRSRHDDRIRFPRHSVQRPLCQHDHYRTKQVIIATNLMATNIMIRSGTTFGLVNFAGNLPGFLTPILNSALIKVIFTHNCCRLNSAYRKIIVCKTRYMSIMPNDPKRLGKPSIKKSAVFFNIVQTGGGSNPCSKIMSEIVVCSGGHLTT